MNASLTSEICWLCGGIIPMPAKAKLETPITELGISNRAKNCLMRGQISYVEQLLKKDKNSLFRLRNLGNKTLNEINNAVENWKQNLSKIGVYD